MYVSPTSKTVLFIDDHTPDTLLAPPTGLSRGYDPRDFSRHPLGFMGHRFSGPIIPRSEWRGLIEQKEREGNTLLHKIRQRGIKCKDQNGTNYCWINAPVYCMEIARAKQGLPYVELSPASVGCKIKGFRNSGGWGTEGMEYMQEHGVVPASMWPVNAINRSYDKPEAWQAAKSFMAWRWDDLDPGDTEQIATRLLMDQPVAIGLNWWRHEVTAICLMALEGGKFGIGCMNSWSEQYGDKGFFILSERKGTGDDQCALVGTNV
jgi:hypothetical protein